MATMTAAHLSIEEARAGDWLELAGSPAGAPPRRGQIVEILGHPGHMHFRVRWDEQHESIVYPEHGAVTVHGDGRRRRRR